MKVLHILHRSAPGTHGYAIRSREIVKAQLGLGITPLVITSPSQSPLSGLDQEHSEIIDGVRHFRSCGTLLAPTEEVQDKSSIKAVLRVGQNVNMLRMAQSVTNKHKPDLIHSHSPFTCGIIGNRVANKNNIPSIYEMRGLWEESHASRRGLGPKSLRYRIVRYLDNKALKSADLCLAIGNGLRNEIISRGVPPEKVDVIPNGVAIDDFTPGPPSDDLKHKLGLDGRFIFGYIGSFFKFEGLWLLIDALAILGDQYQDLRLLLVGDGELTPELKIRAEQKGVKDRIVFTGRVSHNEIAEYYKLFNVMVLPRIQTRLTTLVTPLKPLEIMAMAKPLLASDIGGHREMVIPGVNGTLFKSEDPEDLAEKIRQMKDDPDQRDRLAWSARKWVEENRSWSALALNYAKIYDKLLQIK